MPKPLLFPAIKKIKLKNFENWDYSAISAFASNKMTARTTLHMFANEINSQKGYLTIHRLPDNQFVWSLGNVSDELRTRVKKYMQTLAVQIP